MERQLAMVGNKNISKCFQRFKSFFLLPNILWQLIDETIICMMITKNQWFERNCAAMWQHTCILSGSNHVSTVIRTKLVLWTMEINIIFVIVTFSPIGIVMFRNVARFFKNNIDGLVNVTIG